MRLQSTHGVGLAGSTAQQLHTVNWSAVGDPVRVAGVIVGQV
jgi:hypothetical protein